ncbi:hypothetical protein AX16_004140 [Volvariella volvacea WC 439]|nr:hypothetical protein AX16_004140 [Volvariella volvacea WC 439]
MPLLLESFPVPPSHIPQTPSSPGPPPSRPPSFPLPPVPGPSKISEHDTLLFLTSRRSSRLSVATRRDSVISTSSSTGGSGRGGGSVSPGPESITNSPSPLAGRPSIAFSISEEDPANDDTYLSSSTTHLSPDQHQLLTRLTVSPVPLSDISDDESRPPPPPMLSFRSLRSSQDAGLSMSMLSMASLAPRAVSPAPSLAFTISNPNTPSSKRTANTIRRRIHHAANESISSIDMHDLPPADEEEAAADSQTSLPPLPPKSPSLPMSAPPTTTELASSPVDPLTLHLQMRAARSRSASHKQALRARSTSPSRARASLRSSSQDEPPPVPSIPQSHPPLPSDTTIRQQQQSPPPSSSHISPPLNPPTLGLILPSPTTPQYQNPHPRSVSTFTDRERAPHSPTPLHRPLPSMRDHPDDAQSSTKTNDSPLAHTSSKSAGAINISDKCTPAKRSASSQAHTQSKSLSTLHTPPDPRSSDKSDGDRAPSPDIKTIIRSTPKPRRKSSSYFSSPMPRSRSQSRPRAGTGTGAGAGSGSASAAPSLAGSARTSRAISDRLIGTGMGSNASLGTRGVRSRNESLNSSTSGGSASASASISGATRTSWTTATSVDEFGRKVSASQHQHQQGEREEEEDYGVPLSASDSRSDKYGSGFGFGSFSVQDGYAYGFGDPSSAGAGGGGVVDLNMDDEEAVTRFERQLEGRDGGGGSDSDSSLDLHTPLP